MFIILTNGNVITLVRLLIVGINLTEFRFFILSTITYTHTLVHTHTQIHTYTYTHAHTKRHSGWQRVFHTDGLWSARQRRVTIFGICATNTDRNDSVGFLLLLLILLSSTDGNGIGKSAGGILFVCAPRSPTERGPPRHVIYTAV